MGAWGLSGVEAALACRREGGLAACRLGEGPAGPSPSVCRRAAREGPSEGHLARTSCAKQGRSASLQQLIDAVRKIGGIARLKNEVPGLTSAPPVGTICQATPMPTHIRFDLWLSPVTEITVQPPACLPNTHGWRRRCARPCPGHGFVSVDPMSSAQGWRAGLAR